MARLEREAGGRLVCHGDTVVTDELVYACEMPITNSRAGALRVVLPTTVWSHLPHVNTTREARAGSTYEALSVAVELLAVCGSFSGHVAFRGVPQRIRLWE